MTSTNQTSGTTGAIASESVQLESGVAGAAAPSRGIGAWWMLAVLYALYAVSMLDRYIMYMIAPEIKATFNFSDAEIGLILGPAFSVFYALFGIPFGWCADRFPRRWVIFFGTLVFGAASIGSGLAGTFIALFTMRALVGAGEASLAPCAYSLMGDRFPRQRLSTATAIYLSATDLGNAMAYGLGGIGIVLIAYFGAGAFGGLEPWRLVLILAGAPAVLLAFAVFTFKEPPRKGEPNQRPQDLKIWSYLRGDGRVFIPLLVTFALSGVCMSALASWTPTYLSRQYGMSPAVYGPILAGIGLAASASLVLRGAIVDWFFKRGVKDIHMRFYSWLLVPTIPISIGMWLVDSATVFLVLYAVLQIGSLAILAYLAPTIQLVSPPRMKGRITSAFLVVYSVVGLGLGPPLVGVLTDHVFRDEGKVGYSVMVLMGMILPLTFVIIRMTLKAIREAVTKMERQSQ